MIELSIDIWLLENKYLQVKFFFSIANLIEKSNKFEDSYYKIGDELREFDNDRVQFKHRIWEFIQTNTKQRQSVAGRKNDNNRKPRSAKSPDFFQDNNANKKNTSIKKYTTTRIKSRNFFIKYFLRWYQQGRFLQPELCI